jgi:hypothetical protein
VWLRSLLLVAMLASFGAQTPMPWAGLWLLVPATVAVSLLAAWRFGPWGILVPVALLAAVLALEGPFSLWAWWVPVASLTGVWMGLREEVTPPAGERAWMLLPVLLLAAGLPWTLRYPDLMAGIDARLRTYDADVVSTWRQLGISIDLEAYRRVRRDSLPLVMPTVLFVWAALLVGAGRTLASRVGALLRWPPLSRASLTAWRLPDGALWLLLLGMGVLVARWNTWAPTAWTLLLNTGLGFCVQGIAVVESLLLARGVPPAVIVLTMLFVFAVAWPLFMVATAAVGLSDVWLDYRGLEPAAEEEPH